MKRILALLIILAFSLLVFFTGWTQRRVPAGCCGIVQSKTSGTDMSPVIPGEYAWHWQFLLPSNATVSLFKVQPFSSEPSVSGRIAQAVSSSPAWSYSFKFSITLSYLPDSIARLFSENYISSEEDFESYLGNAAQTIAQKAADFYLGKLQENPDFRPESVSREELVKAVDSYRDFPELDIIILTLTDYTLPNYRLLSLDYAAHDYSVPAAQEEASETGGELL